jgi:5'-3' exonuclease
LIFLSLATHEPFFYILREEVFKKSKHPSYEFLRMEILREYIRKEFKELPNVERSIDDFVFMCMLVGNDFLPRLPSLDIQEGSIDTLISTYKMNFSKMGGYMCDAGDIDLKRLNMFISKLGLSDFFLIFKAEMEQFIFQTKLKRDDYLREEKLKQKLALEEPKKHEEYSESEEEEEEEVEEEEEELVEEKHVEKTKLVPLVKEKKIEEQEKSKQIYVANIPMQTTMEELQAYFFKAGTVVAATIKNHKFNDQSSKIPNPIKFVRICICDI